MFRLVVFLVAAFATAPLAAEPSAAKPKTVRLLTVGNSFSQNATRYLDGLAKAAGYTLVHRPIVVGGASLALHWGKAEQHERDPKNPSGLYGKKSLRQELMADSWDYITIQQASFISHDVATYRPFAKKLYDCIKKAAPKAEVLIHQTWAYRADDPRFTKPASKPGEPVSRQKMHEGLTHAYETIAAELGARLIPVGDAFNLAETDPNGRFKPDQHFDFKNAQPPALPDQTHSLHVGWRWMTTKDGKKKLAMDGHHANMAGEYLGSCVFFEVLFGESSVGNAFVPRGLDCSIAEYLQKTAHQAVINRKAKKS